MGIKNGDMPAMPYKKSAKESDEYGIRVYAGLTKREAMAMAAMQGLLSKHGDDDYDKPRIAKYAVEHADALLAELERTSASASK